MTVKNDIVAANTELINIKFSAAINSHNFPAIIFPIGDAIRTNAVLVAKTFPCINLGVLDINVTVKMLLKTN